jgi:branched-chain amino acid aminotransferase
MAKLQRPDYAYMNGAIIPWDEANLHIGCEAITRGLNVFEGLKGYWHGPDAFGILFLRRHYARMCRSAKLLHIPCPWTFEQYEEAVCKLYGALLRPDSDMWMRTSLYVIEGHWGENTKADLVLTAYHMNTALPEPITVGVSTWQRSSDNSLPARIKTSTNYQVARLARIEGRQRGCDDMILLNHAGRVAEAAASCVLIVRDGVIYTPPASEGALESITVDWVERIAEDLGIPFVRRPIDRSELPIADEMALCGTLAELVPVKSMDGFAIDPDGPILSKVRQRFFRLVRGEGRDPTVEISFVPVSSIRSMRREPAGVETEGR